MTYSKLLDDLLAHHPITLVDVGAKGGVISLGDLDAYIHAFGLEPDPEEFERLKKAEKNNKQFKSLKYFNQALGMEEKQMEFYLAGNSSYNSLLAPDLENYARHLEMVESFDSWKRNIETKGIIEIQATTLDKFSIRENVPYIDLLKLDTQGSELQLLKGAEVLLESKAISMIRTEVSFLSVYKEQCLFGDMDQFLRANHFIFVDCVFYPDGIPQTAFLGSGSIKEKARYSLGGDALYIVDIDQIPLDLRKERAVKAALQLAQAGYFSLSKSILLKYSSYNERTVMMILKYFYKKPFSYHVRSMFNGLCPPLLKAFLKKIRTP